MSMIALLCEQGENNLFFRHLIRMAPRTRIPPFSLGRLPFPPVLSQPSPFLSRMPPVLFLMSPFPLGCHSSPSRTPPFLSRMPPFSSRMVPFLSWRLRFPHGCLLFSPEFLFFLPNISFFSSWVFPGTAPPRHTHSTDRNRDNRGSRLHFPLDRCPK